MSYISELTLRRIIILSVDPPEVTWKNLFNVLVLRWFKFIHPAGGDIG